MNTQIKTQDIALMGLMAAIVFVATFAIKFPTFTGYLHLGDSMVILSVMLLGVRKGALAAGVGAAMADLVGGYGAWIFPTFLCKAAMALVIGFLRQRFSKRGGRFLWVLASVAGGITEVIGYFLSGLVLYDWAGAVGGIIGNIFQFTIGIALAFVVAEMLQKSALRKKLVFSTHGGREDAVTRAV